MENGRFTLLSPLWGLTSNVRCLSLGSLESA